MNSQMNITLNDIATISQSLQIPDMPSTRKGWAKWVAVRGLASKAQSAQGGGECYPLSVFPESLQRAINPNFSSPLQSPTQSHVPTTCYQKRRGRLLILNACDRYHAQHPQISRTALYQKFANLYNDKLLLIADDVYKVIPSISAPTLSRWFKERSTITAKNLIPVYGNRKDKGILDLANNGKIKKHILGLLSQNAFLQASHIRDDVRSRFGQTLHYMGQEVALPSYRSFQRYVAKVKENYKLGLSSLQNPDAHKSKYQMAFGDMSMAVTQPNMVWEIDASPVDALCIDGRKNLYVIEDIYSRRIKVLISNKTHSHAACKLIRMAIEDWGMPQMIITDNGADFVANMVEITLLQAGIYHDTTNPFSGEEKPHVERVIGTLQRNLMRIVPGFCGHNVTDRKMIEAKKAFAKRLGEDADKAFMAELTAQELQDICNEWVEGKYHHTPHSSLKGKTPYQLIADWHEPIIKCTNTALLKMLFAPVTGNPTRVVGKKGIKYEGHYYGGVDMIPYRGQEVIVRYDFDDASTLYLVDPETYQFIGEAICPTLRGQSPQALAKQLKKAGKHWDALARKELNEAGKIALKDGTMLEVARGDWQATINKHDGGSIASNNIAEAVIEAAPDNTNSNVISINQIYEKNERIKKAQKIEMAIANNAYVPADDIDFIERYRQTAEYRVSVQPILPNHRRA